MTNPGSITTIELVEIIKRSPMGLRLLTQGKQFSFFANEEEFMRVAAKAPRSHCVLNSSKLARHGVKMTELHEAIEEALHNWQPS